MFVQERKNKVVYYNLILNKRNEGVNKSLPLMFVTVPVQFTHFKTHFMILPSTPLSPKWVSSLHIFRLKWLMHCEYLPCAHLFLLDFIILIIFGYKYKL